MNNKRGFTLIELMIVIAVISILLGATFKLMGVAADAKARAVTVSRLERLQNALSGYYAAYGMYPAVPIYQNPNLNDIVKDSDTDDTVDPSTAKGAITCARAQPIAFEYPTPLLLDVRITDPNFSTKLQSLIKDKFAVSINEMVHTLHGTETSWEQNKGFKFGLMSFLLPRVDVVGLPDSEKGPNVEVYKRGQWKENNPISRNGGDNPTPDLITQRGLEEGVCKNWLPNLENMMTSFKKDVYGIKIGGGIGLVARGKTNDTSRIYLAQSTITDGWGNEFFYHCAPPHQSYRIWSAGADKNTFPPWENLTQKGEAWIKDDIVGGKM